MFPHILVGVIVGGFVHMQIGRSIQQSCLGRRKGQDGWLSHPLTELDVAADTS
jgi:hypothetical protein